MQQSRRWFQRLSRWFWNLEVGSPFIEGAIGRATLRVRRPLLGHVSGSAHILIDELGCIGKLPRHGRFGFTTIDDDRLTAWFTSREALDEAMTWLADQGVRTSVDRIKMFRHR